MPGRWQLVNDGDEGWITLSLVMDTDLLAKMLVFGLAGFVEILEPPALKDSVLAQARAVIQDLEG
jgi:hypothetical protein